MTRALLISLALASIAYALADHLAAHDWLIAAPLGVVLCAGIVLIAPGASAHPSLPPQPEAPALANPGVAR